MGQQEIKKKGRIPIVEGVAPSRWNLSAQAGEAGAVPIRIGDDLIGYLVDEASLGKWVAVMPDWTELAACDNAQHAFNALSRRFWREIYPPVPSAPSARTQNVQTRPAGGAVRVTVGATVAGFVVRQDDGRYAAHAADWRRIGFHKTFESANVAIANRYRHA